MTDLKKVCNSCGMPMSRKQDFALGDTEKEYCVHCAKEDGSMKSFEEKVNGMTQFVIKTQGLEEQVAKKVAIEMLKKQPAWKNV